MQGADEQRPCHCRLLSATPRDADHSYPATIEGVKRVVMRIQRLGDGA